jgi:hypothetical protein
MVQIYLEQAFKDLDLARSAMWEAVQNTNMAKDAIVEAKVADARAHIKDLVARLDEMNVQIQNIKNKSNE